MIRLALPCVRRTIPVVLGRNWWRSSERRRPIRPSSATRQRRPCRTFGSLLAQLRVAVRSLPGRHPVSVAEHGDCVACECHEQPVPYGKWLSMDIVDAGTGETGPPLGPVRGESIYLAVAASMKTMDLSVTGAFTGAKFWFPNSQ